jgi:hypothetical protein
MVSLHCRVAHRTGFATKSAAFFDTIVDVMRPGFAIAAALIFCTSPVRGQECPPAKMTANMQNLTFADGSPGIAPPGWLLGPEWWFRPAAPAYAAETVSGAACSIGKRCAHVRWIADPPSMKLTLFYQLVDAAPYRGKLLTFSAVIRTEAPPESMARLLIHIHGAGCRSAFRDDMGDHPIISDRWAAYKVRAPVGPDAVYVEFGMQLIGRGSAWIDNVSMAPSGN